MTYGLTNKKGKIRPNRNQKPVDFIDGEIWKPVVGFEGCYEVSNLGRVKSLPRKTTKGGLIKPYTQKTGYVYVGLSKDGKACTLRLHRVVLEAFTDYRSQENPLLGIDHIDGDKTNNRLENLEPVLGKENMRRAKENGLLNDDGEFCIDLDTYQVYKSFTAAAKALGSGQGELVRRVCDGKRSHYKNHRFARLTDFVNGSIPMYTGKTEKKASESLWR